MLETLRSYADAGKYKRVPVSRELYADCLYPCGSHAHAPCGEQTLLSAGKRGGQTAVGKVFFSRVCADYGDHLHGRSCGHYGGRRGRRESQSGVDTDHPGGVLRKILEDYRSPVMEGMPPFTGGLVGYFSYDYIKYAEPSLKKVLTRSRRRNRTGIPGYGSDAL